MEMFGKNIVEKKINQVINGYMVVRVNYLEVKVMLDKINLIIKI